MSARIIIVVCAVSLAGCLNTSTVVRVAPDGSGTLEQTLLFNIKSVENAFAGMGLKSSGKSSSQKNPVDENMMKEAAAELGNGVTLVSVTPVKLPSGFEGVTARFRFDDITTLNTEDMLMPGPAKEAAAGNAQNRVAFALTRTPAGTSILTATFDDSPVKAPKEKGSGKNGGGAPSLDDPEVRQIVKALVKGSRSSARSSGPMPITWPASESRSSRSTSSSSCSKARSSTRSTRRSDPTRRLRSCARICAT
jgi:hypothetical protein